MCRACYCVCVDFSAACLGLYNHSQYAPLLGPTEHLKRVSGVLRSRWLCDAKPVLLRLTLSEQEARARHTYLQVG